MILELLLSAKLITSVCRDVILPSCISRDECDRTEHTAGYTRCSFRDRSLTAQINSLVEDRLKKGSEYDSCSDETEPPNQCDAGSSYFHIDSMCERPFQLADIVSFNCRVQYSGGRQSETEFFAVNLQITSEGLREVKLRELFASQDAQRRFWALVRADIRHQLAEVCQEPNADSNEHLKQSLEAANEKYESFYLTKVGLAVAYDRSAFGQCIVESTIPYPQLRGILAGKLLR